jgi:hypothetical protein
LTLEKIATIVSTVAELENLTLQTRLSQEMNYLTLVTLGITRYAADDWDGAIAQLTAALEQIKDPMPMLSQNRDYFARAYSYNSKKDYNRAIATPRPSNSSLMMRMLTTIGALFTAI